MTFLYDGKHSAQRHSYRAGAIVMKLSEGIPKNQGYRLFFLNCFFKCNATIEISWNTDYCNFPCESFEKLSAYIR